MRIELPSLALSLALLVSATAAQADRDVRAFFFGNSLIHHLTDTDETTVPYWLAKLADAGEQGFASDGTWGFLDEWAVNLPPQPEWKIEGVTPVWDTESFAFRRAGFNTIILNPANFIHYDPPDNELRGPSAVELTKRIFDWASNQSEGMQFYLYEGWSNMEDIADYPPGRRGLARYFAFNMGEYHDWNVEYLDAVERELPDLPIRPIPVASVLARVLTETSLSDIPVEEIYSDISPHGTATKYLLAAMVTYSVLYNAPAPAIDLPDTIHPILRDNYALASAAIWAGLNGSAMPQDAATLRPAGALADPWLGMGLSGIADYATQQPFIDVMKTARTWVGHTTDQWGAWDAVRLADEGYLDENGWLRAIPPELDRVEALFLNEQPAAFHSLAGRYRVTWEGQGTVYVGGLARDATSAPNEIWFSYTPGPGVVWVGISATDPADPVRNIKVIREDLIPLYDEGQRFNHDWLRVVGDMRAVRFMDWMTTNGSPQVTWADRPQPDDYSYGWRGVPVEVMVDLANTIGADPWFTLPHMADDAYVTAFATYVRDNLDPRLKVYAEWSNEVWNFIFPQTHWTQQQAISRWGDVAADNGGWMQFAGFRAAEVADIWSTVFADQADVRLVRVIATQTGWKGLEDPLLNAPLAQAEGLPAPFESFDAYAVTGYFGYDLGSEEMADRLRDWIAEGDATERVTDALRDGSFDDLVHDLFPYHADVAADHNLQLVMYEGGTHLTGIGPVVDDAAITAFLTDYNYSKDMAALYDDLFAGWQKAGGTLFMGFVDVAPASKWGSWGALRHLDDMNPRWSSIARHNADTPVTWETRIPGTFAGTIVQQ
jgi:hypothetical protein